jgi:hypothetical protein
VDSGQILICDPSYIDSTWENEEFDMTTLYRHVATREVIHYPGDFQRYDQVLPKFGKTMNDMIETREVKELLGSAPKHSFSYNACCKATTREEGYGQLNFPAGHAGVGVALSSGWGDGEYPVYALIEEGRVKKVWVEFF